MTKKQKQRVDNQGFSDLERQELKEIVQEAMDEDRVVCIGSWLGELAAKMDQLDMLDDDLEVVIGGSAVYEIEGDGTKWKPVKGTRKYNKDAFIVIRRPQPVVSSRPGDWEDK